MEVKNISDVAMLLEDGNSKRAVAAHNLNEFSSRSHAVFQVPWPSMTLFLACSEHLWQTHYWLRPSQCHKIAPTVSFILAARAFCISAICVVCFLDPWPATKSAHLRALYWVFSMIHAQYFSGACLLSCPNHMMFGIFELEVYGGKHNRKWKQQSQHLVSPLQNLTASLCRFS